MTTIRPNVQSQAFESPFFYNTSLKVLSFPDKIQQATDTFVAKRTTGSKGQKLMAAIAKKVGGFLKEAVTFDHNVFHNFSIRGKNLFRVATPPMGIMLWYLYPFTIVPRLYRARQRGMENGQNDMRGFWDVLRRDGIAITFLMFLLHPLQYAMNRFIMEPLAGLRLVDRDTAETLPYARMKNYRIDSPKALLALLESGNGKGVRKAVDLLSKRGLFEMGGEALKAEVEAIQQKMPGLIQQVEQAAKGGDAAGRSKTLALAEEVFQHFENGENHLKDVLQKAKAVGEPKLVKLAEKLQGEVKDVVVKFAERRRLPSDVLSILLCVVAIGWFPVWFNAQWNRKDFERKKMQARASELPSFNPRQTWQALQSTSRLAQQRGVQATGNPWLAQ
jgi:hypothetical protein